MSPVQDQPMVTRRGLRIAAIAACAVVGIVVVTGIAMRRMADARLSEWTEDQALPVVKVEAPDLRGKKSSIELPGRLEAYSPRDRTPSIVLSANTGPEDRQASAAAGADDHIGKPIRAEALLGAIVGALGEPEAMVELASEA